MNQEELSCKRTVSIFSSSKRQHHYVDLLLTSFSDYILLQCQTKAALRLKHISVNKVLKRIFHICISFVDDLGVDLGVSVILVNIESRYSHTLEAKYEERHILSKIFTKQCLYKQAH